MASNSAAYMREYRARKKFTVTEVNPGELEELRSEIERLTEEVARLKRELAARPAPTDTSLRSYQDISREAQANRDEILRRINRAK